MGDLDVVQWGFIFLNWVKIFEEHKSYKNQKLQQPSPEGAERFKRREEIVFVKLIQKIRETGDHNWTQNCVHTFNDKTDKQETNAEKRILSFMNQLTSISVFQGEAYFNDLHTELVVEIPDSEHLRPKTFASYEEIQVLLN